MSALLEDKRLKRNPFLLGGSMHEHFRSTLTFNDELGVPESERIEFKF